MDSGWIILNGNYGVIILLPIYSISTWTCVLHVAIAVVLA